MTTWTTEMDDALRANVAAGDCSSAGMAAAINRAFNVAFTRNAVIGRRNRLGLSGKRTRPQIALPRRPRIERKSNHVITTKLIKFSQVKPDGPALPIVEGLASSSGPITLFDLKPTSCRWPFGHGPFLFCGHTVCNGDPKNSYCIGHSLKSYTKPAPRAARPFYRAA